MVVVSSTFSAPVEGVLSQTPGTKLLVDGQELGTATLYITENNVVWGGGVGANGGASATISMLYPNISLHAIQREPVPALFVVLGHELRLPGQGQAAPGQAHAAPGQGQAAPGQGQAAPGQGQAAPGQGQAAGDADEDDDDEFDADDPPSTNLLFVPQNEADLQPMYQAMIQGQALHPDPQDEVDEEPYMDGEEFDDGDEEFEDAEESDAGDAGDEAGGAGGAGGAGEAAARLRALRLHRANGTADEGEDEIADE